MPYTRTSKKKSLKRKRISNYSIPNIPSQLHNFIDVPQNKSEIINLQNQLNTIYNSLLEINKNIQTNRGIVHDTLLGFQNDMDLKK